MRFPHDLYEGKVAQVSHSDYINDIKELTTTIWSQARNVQRISQLEAAHYYNIKHGIKRDVGTGDLVLRRKIPANPTDVPSHLLPRCTGLIVFSKLMLEEQTSSAMLYYWSTTAFVAAQPPPVRGEAW